MLKLPAFLFVSLAATAYGQLQWTRQFGTAQADRAVSVAANSTGVFVLYATETAIPGLPNHSLRKLGLDGSTQWDVTIALPMALRLNGVAADETGAYVAGLISADSLDAWVRKYDNAGAVRWSRQFGSPHADEARAVAADGSAVYVAGNTNSIFAGQTTAGGFDAFVARLDPDGNVLWIRQFGSASSDGANAVAVAGGVVYVGGLASLPIQGGTGTGTGFLRAYDANGGHLWTRHLGENILRAAAFGSSVYVVGGPLSGITKLNSSGATQWTGRTLGDEESFSGLAADATGVYAAGTSVLIGVNLLDADATLVKLDEAGNTLWSRVARTAQGDSFQAVTASQGRVWAAGNTLGALGGPTAGGDDVFVQSYSGADALYFIPMRPCRILSTGFAPGTNALQAGETRNIPIAQQANCGVPAAARAYALDFGATPAEPLGYLTVWPGGPRPLASTLNSPHGGPVSNLALVAAESGAVNVYASNRTELTIDVTGYFVTDSRQGYGYYPLNPCRMLDTRRATGGPALAANTGQRFLFTSGCGIPADSAAAAVNVTAVPAGPLGSLSAWMTGTPPPLLPLLSAPDGAVTAKAAILAGGNQGSISLLAGQPADAVVDAAGYFGPSGGAGALKFYPLTACRAADTRLGAGVVRGGDTRDFPIGGTCGVPATAKAFALNYTVVPPGPLAFLTAWPAGVARPPVSTLNSFSGRVVANAGLTPAGTGGAVSVYATNDTHVVIDVTGYFE